MYVENCIMGYYSIVVWAQSITKPRTHRPYAKMDYNDYMPDYMDFIKIACKFEVRRN